MKVLFLHSDVSEIASISGGVANPANRIAGQGRAIPPY